MTTPESIEITNFRGIGYIKLYFDKDQQVIKRIEGKTGIGKSSIVDAFVWAHYGKTKESQKGDDVLNNTVKKDCSVIVQYENFRVSRYRKHHEFKNDVILESLDNGEWNSKDLTVKGSKIETQKNIDKMLGGISMDVYCKIISFGQGDEKIGNWGDLKDKALKQATTEALGLEQIDHDKQKISKYLKEVVEVHEKNNSKDALKIDVDNITFKIETLEESISENISNDSQKEKAHTKEKEDEKKAINNKISVAKKGIEELNNIVVISEDEFLEKTKDKEAKLKKLEQVKELKERANSKKIDSESGVSVVYSDIAKTEKKYNSNIKKMDNIKDLVGTNCNECGKVYESSDDKTTIEAIQKTQKELKEENERQFILKAEKEKVLKQDSDTLSKILEAKKNIEKELSDIQVIENQYNEDKLTGEKKKSAKAVIDQLKENIKTVDERKFIKYDSSKDEQKVSLLKKELKISNEKYLEALRQYDGEQLLIDTLKETIETVEAQKGYIIDSITVPLNENIQRCVKELIPEMNIEFQTLKVLKSGEYREKFNIKVEIKGGAKNYKQLSGGQKAVFNLCISLGFIITMRQQQNNLPDFLFVDEGFAALDIDLASLALNILLDVVDIKNMYVMSHQLSLQEIIPDTIKLYRENNQTFIKE